MPGSQHTVLGILSGLKSVGIGWIISTSPSGGTKSTIITDLTCSLLPYNWLVSTTWWSPSGWSLPSQTTWQSAGPPDCCSHLKQSKQLSWRVKWELNRHIFQNFKVRICHFSGHFPDNLLLQFNQNIFLTSLKLSNSLLSSCILF